MSPIYSQFRKKNVVGRKGGKSGGREWKKITYQMWEDINNWRMWIKGILEFFLQFLKFF